MKQMIIHTENLTKIFGKNEKQYCAVDNVNINVEQGKIYALLGRNGAGKTTLMRMLLGLAKPNKGKITILNNLCFDSENQKILSKQKRISNKFVMQQIGSLIEGPGFYENLSAYENLEILMRLRGRNKKNEIEEALNVVGLEATGKKLVRDFSLGMKQRLGIAQAIMHGPELLILDEPINGLDPVGIHAIRDYLNFLCKEKGITIFISSHILSEIEVLADTIGVIHEGQLIEEIDMALLNKRNRQFIEIVVSDTNRASLILEEVFHVSDYKVYADNSIRIFSSIDRIAEINKKFITCDIDVSKLTINCEKLEDYFSRLIGGGKIG